MTCVFVLKIEFCPQLPVVPKVNLRLFWVHRVTQVYANLTKLCPIFTRMNGAMVPVTPAEHVKMTVKSGKVPEDLLSLPCVHVSSCGGSFAMVFADPF